MEKQIKKLLEQERLTGEDAGRLMILDLLAAYKDLINGGAGTGVLTDNQKIEIVEGLTSSEDIRRFNDYRGVHEFLTTVSAIYESFAKTYEAHYWKLLNLLMNLRHAEEENNLSARRPVIMTKKQYELFAKTGKVAPESGIAVLTVNPSKQNLDEQLLYKEPVSDLRRFYMAEAVLENHSALMQQSINGMKDMLSECSARRKALELIARFIKIPQIKTFIPPTNEENIAAFNILISEIIISVKRSDSHSPEYEKELRHKLSAILTPINLEALQPSTQAVSSARKILSFSLIKSGSEAFVAMLKRKWRNE